jgi:hypothetical protein
MQGPGNTEGGWDKFAVGSILSGLSIYYFLDSVRITAGRGGFFSGWLHSNGFETTSMGLIFIPFVLGVVALFWNVKYKWGWWLLGGGLGIIIIDIMSRIQFLMNIKTTHLLILLMGFAAGLGLILRSYRKES